MRVSARIITSLVAGAIIALGMAVEAPAQVAPGVTQSAAHTATMTGKVTGSDGAPIAGAEVSLSGAAVFSTKTDPQGIFQFTGLPWGIYQISVSSPYGVATRRDITVNGDLNVAVQYQAPSALRTIAHVSTTSAGAHINITPASIASVAPSDFAFQGNATWTQLLNQVPGVVVNGSLQGGEQISDWLVGSPITPQIPSINGALPYETSVTLDGMPLESQTTIGSPGAGFDMAGLPPAAFDAADVVRGPGANSPSIVDSIGGSLVLHAPGEVERDSAEYSISNDPWGGIVSNLKVAGRFGRLSVILIYGVNDSPGTYGNASVIPVGQSPYEINGEPVTGPIEGDVYCNTGPHTGHVTYFYNYCGLSETLLFCCTQYSSAWSQHNGAVSLEYDVSPNVKAQVFYVGTQSALNGDPFGLHLTDFEPAAGYSGSIPPGFSNQMELNPYILYQHSSLLEEKITAFIGQGVFRIAAVQNNSGSFANHLPPQCIPNGMYTLYGTATVFNGASNVTETFNGTPAQLTFPSIFLTEQFGSYNRDILASYDTQVGSSLHVGVSYTKSYYDTYDYVPLSFFGSPIVAVCNVNPANSSTLSEYRFNAGGNISDKFTIDGSWFFARDDFHTQTQEQVISSPWQDDVFNYAAPRVGLTWHPSSNIVYRAAAGGGFAVPSLGQLASQSPTAADNCALNICSTTIANLALQPEKSFAFDAGTDMRFNANTTLSLDLYHANLYGQFFTSNSLGSYTGPPVLGCTSPPCPLYISQTKNLAATRYEGINLSLDHNPVSGVYWHFGLGFIRAFIVNLPGGFYTGPTSFASCPSGHPNECTNTELIPGINFDGATQSGIPPVPYAQGYATLGYRWGPGTFVDIAPTYYGNGNSYFEPAFVEFDVHTGYALGRYFTVYATLRNATNKYGQSFATIGVPTLTAPAAIGFPYGLWGIPYGPRSVIVTANFHS